jgi:hypothetical protein
MPVYTVHEPPLRGSQANADPDRFVFVREGAYGWAFLLTPLWLLWRGLWFAFIVYLVLTILIEAGLKFAGADAAAQVFAGLLISLFVSLEAASLLRGRLAYRGYRMVGSVVGKNIEAAEHRFFAGWVEEQEARSAGREAAQAPVAATATAARGRPAGIVGLFPEPGGH